ncbi:MotA/TolQ/ExbB proton channel family protein [Caryophanon latum]|uniref:MotA/TolQ/ExbB proton channel domain-containing protein n=1 Tax=Caryophanon latum TaxID=33977 RepID=A0A1C0YJF9_9BACL|nr:MotA/TolQ/ExbB proton channel family protein [Caryophanon latum]OCS87281.1 hypothetical protein A6K76_02620 [Caryophanon latum]
MGDFNTIGNVFNNLNGFTIGYIIVQAVIFLGLRARYKKSKKTENQALENIEAAIKNNPNEQWTNYTLNELFEQQDANSKFVQQWKRYYERVSKNDEDEKIKVERYLGVEALTYAVGERGILDVGGGVHTSIGVLGTFIGLIIGLSDLNTLDAEQLRSGIDTLMSGMTTAFVTSVVGVVLSLAWLYFDRRATMKLDAKIDWHAHTFAALLDVDDEQLFLNRLQKISQQQAEQMTTLLTDALERAFTPFTETMRSGFGRMETQLQTQNDLVEKQMELTQNQSADLSEKLVDSLTNDTKTIMQDFMNVLHTSKSIQENMVQAVGDITTKFEVAAAKQEEVFNRTEQMMQSYTALSEGMAKSQSSYEKASEELSALSVSLKDVQQLSNAQLPLQQEVLARSSEFVESSNDLIVQFSKFGQQLQEAQTSMLDQLVEKTEAVSTRFETLATELTKSAESYADAADTNLQLLAKTELTADALTPVVAHMEGTAESLHNTMEQLKLLQERQAELIPHLQKWNDDVLTYLENFTGLSETQLEEVTKQVQYSKEQWEATASTFDDTRRQLDVAMNSFSTGIEKGLTTTFQQFEQELTTVIKHFKSLSGAYLESQENLSEAMQQTVEKLAYVRGRD